MPIAMADSQIPVLMATWQRTDGQPATKLPDFDGQSGNHLGLKSGCRKFHRIGNNPPRLQLLGV